MATPNYTIDSAKQTVAGQLNGLLQQDSPYIKQAKTQGEQFANQRGLLNSSIAAGASENAAIQAALPIASADAATHNSFESQKYGANLQKDVTSDQIKLSTNADMAVKGYTFDLSQKENASQAYYNSLTTNQQGVANILADPNLTPEAKTAAIDNLRKVTNASLSGIARSAGGSMPVQYTPGSKSASKNLTSGNTSASIRTSGYQSFMKALDDL